jgi:excisionase family DNA binding protein
MNDAVRKGVARMSEAAAYLSVGRSTLYGLLHAGELQSVKIGRGTRITWNSLEEFVRRNLNVTWNKADENAAK